jgi:serine/threonine protein kinase
MTHSNCLNPDRIRDFSLGRVDAEAEREIWEHLETCAVCSRAASEFDGEQDSFVEWLRGPRRPSEAVDDAHYRQAQNRVKQLLDGRANDLPAAQASANNRPTCTSNDNSSGSEVPSAAAEPGEEHRLPVLQLRDYRLLRKIGEGGMGTVYEALHTRLERVVALKILPPERMANAQAVARFQQEMRAAGAFDHPAIVRATDAGDVDGTHFLVMEYVEGIDLSSLSRQTGPLPVAEACALIRQAALGLEHVHERGIVHRDIKPSNLMLTPQGQVKVLDLGLALLQEQSASVDGLTTVGQFMGTLDYMAPEQADDSHEVDSRADIYSLGATLYKLLCGRPPYSGRNFNTPLKKFKGLALLPVPPISQHRPDLPEPLVSVIERMLSKDPHDRFQSLAEVAEALERFAAEADLEQLLKSAAGRDETHASANDGLPGAMIPVAADDSQRSLDPGPQPKGAAHRWGRWTAIVAIGLLTLIAAGVTLHIATDAGELVIESHVDDVEIEIRKADETVRDLKLQQGANRTTLRSGAYEIVLKGQTDGLQIAGNRFTLTRGDEHVATVEHISLAKGEAGRRGIVPLGDRSQEHGWQPLRVRLVDEDGQPVPGSVRVAGTTFQGGKIDVREQTAENGWADLGQVPAGQLTLEVSVKELSERTSEKIVTGPGRPRDYTIVCPTEKSKRPVPIRFDIQPPNDLADLDLYYIANLRFVGLEFAGRKWTRGWDQDVTLLIRPDSTIVGTIDKDAAMTADRRGRYTSYSYSETLQPDVLETAIETIPLYEDLSQGILVDFVAYTPTSPATDDGKLPVLKRISVARPLRVREFNFSHEAGIKILISQLDEKEREFWSEIRSRMAPNEQTAAPTDDAKPSDLNQQHAPQPLKVRLVDEDGQPTGGLAGIYAMTFPFGKVSRFERAGDDGWADLGQVPAGQYLLIASVDDPSETTGERITVGPSHPREYTIVGPTAPAEPVPITFDIQPPEDLADLKLYYVAKLQFQNRKFADRLWKPGNRHNVTLLIGPDLKILGSVEEDAVKTTTHKGFSTRTTYSRVIQPELLQTDIDAFPAYNGRLTLLAYMPKSPTNTDDAVPELQKMSATDWLKTEFVASEESGITIRVREIDDGERKFWDAVRVRKARF